MRLCLLLLIMHRIANIISEARGLVNIWIVHSASQSCGPVFKRNILYRKRPCVFQLSGNLGPFSTPTIFAETVILSLLFYTPNTSKNTCSPKLAVGRGGGGGRRGWTVDTYHTTAKKPGLFFPFNVSLETIRATY